MLLVIENGVWLNFVYVNDEGFVGFGMNVFCVVLYIVDSFLELIFDYVFFF